MQSQSISASVNGQHAAMIEKVEDTLNNICIEASASALPEEVIELYQKAIDLAKNRIEVYFDYIRSTFTRTKYDENSLSKVEENRLSHATKLFCTHIDDAVAKCRDRIRDENRSGHDLAQVNKDLIYALSEEIALSLRGLKSMRRIQLGARGQARRIRNLEGVLKLAGDKKKGLLEAISLTSSKQLDTSSYTLIERQPPVKSREANLQADEEIVTRIKTVFAFFTTFIKESFEEIGSEGPDSDALVSAIEYLDDLSCAAATSLDRAENILLVYGMGEEAQKQAAKAGGPYASLKGFCDESLQNPLRLGERLSPKIKDNIKNSKKAYGAAKLTLGLFVVSIVESKVKSFSRNFPLFKGAIRVFCLASCITCGVAAAQYHKVKKIKKSLEEALQKAEANLRNDIERRGGRGK